MEPNLKTDKLLRTIKSNDLNNFFVEWSIVKNQLTEKEKQDLLVDIFEYYYEEDEFPFFKNILDKIIESKVSLNFSIKYWTPTFLSIAINRTSRQLFDYLLRYGAKLNFIGDKYEGESEETIKKEVEDDNDRYSTCLDFAQLKLDDMLTTDFNLAEMSWEKIKDYDPDEEPVGNITISKREYLQLLEQSEYLHDLIKLDRLVDHIKSLGGKEYSELVEERKAHK
jgi:hypothetical protein